MRRSRPRTPLRASPPLALVDIAASIEVVTQTSERLAILVVSDERAPTSLGGAKLRSAPLGAGMDRKARNDRRLSESFRAQMPSGTP